jgi:hypothetical protein
MTSKSELGLMMAALFSAFGREMTAVDVDAWHLVLGDMPRGEVAPAIWQAAKCCDSMPPASRIRRLVLDRRVSSTKNMTTTTQQAMQIAGLVKDYRRANPHATADEVAEYVTRLQQRLATVQ